MLLLCRYILYFTLYSFTGWVIESTFCSIVEGKPVNRGFLNGPFCPIYAVGALAMVLISSGLPRNIFLIFFFGFFITSAIEYLTGLLLEVAFKAKWWDYSNEKFNLQGRVCLKNSICFGLMSVALLFIIHPAVAHEVALLPVWLTVPLAAVFAVYFIFDLTVTVGSILGLNNRLEAIQRNVLAAKEKLDAYGFYTTAGIRDRIERFLAEHEPETNLYETIRSIAEHIVSAGTGIHAVQRRLIRAFPELKSLRYPETIGVVREILVTGLKPKTARHEKAHTHDGQEQQKL